ncbi:hypothetical protein CJP74_06665 [Psittacicella melopsittaci]|uniref:ATP synthase subunit delta n=1 Tax=Psittacicella melopsittaci TaxID=2028576 RepID=A0A3A1Y389_9GAMM|nr:F0F1 ATP synthase subunit delta [Psittacicella melopsittaci]RIY31678.1 hypothetical protein CJP74_06665 [Psittacicella melopsittaci]
MENVTTVSRPYATAVFEYALEQANKEQALAFWNDVLLALKVIMETSVGQEILAEHNDHQAEVKNFVDAVLPDELKTNEVNNFLNTVEEHSRFGYLPGIYDFYVSLRENYDLPTPVTIISATELSEEQLKQIGQSVAFKVGRAVKLDVQIDPTILSGIIIKTEDFSIDCSGRKTLENLSAQLTK